MDSPLLPIVAGFIAAALVLPLGWCARRFWAWLRRDKLVDEQREEIVQARRTIQQLNKIMGNTETTFMPLGESQRLGEMFGRK